MRAPVAAAAAAVAAAGQANAAGGAAAAAAAPGPAAAAPPAAAPPAAPPAATPGTALGEEGPHHRGLTLATMLNARGGLPVAGLSRGGLSAAVAYHSLYWRALTPAAARAARAVVEGTYDRATHVPVSTDVAQEVMRLARARWGAADGRTLAPYQGAQMLHVPFVHGHVVLASTLEPAPRAGDVADPESWVIVDGYASFDQENCRALLAWPGILLQDPAAAADPELAAQAWEALAPGCFWTEWSGAALSHAFPNAQAIRSAIERIRAGYEALVNAGNKGDLKCA